MRYIFIWLIPALILPHIACTSQFVTQSQTLPAPEGWELGNDVLVFLNTAPGQSLIVRSGTPVFWQLVIWMSTAQTALEAGGVSALVILHALGVNQAKINQPVTSLSDMQNALANYSVKSTVYDSAMVDVDFVKQQWKEVFADGKHYVVAHFNKADLGMPPGGEFAPIGAYDKQSDRFLVMEVERERFAPYWVKAADLWRAMQGKGYLVAGYTSPSVFASVN